MFLIYNLLKHLSDSIFFLLKVNITFIAEGDIACGSRTQGNIACVTEGKYYLCKD